MSSSRKVLAPFVITILSGCSVVFGWSDLQGGGGSDAGSSGTASSSSGSSGSSGNSDAGTGDGGDGGNAPMPNGIECRGQQCVGAERCCFSQSAGRTICATQENCINGDYYFPCFLQSQCDLGSCCTAGAGSTCSAATCSVSAGQSRVCDERLPSEGQCQAPTVCQANTPTLIYSCR